MRPDVRSFDDYRLFLREHIRWMGTQDRKYSLRWLAARVGFTSPSMLSMIISGQRVLPRDKLSSLTQACKLLPDECEYFRLLYEWQCAEDPLERQRFEKQMIQDHRGGLFQDPDDEGYEVFTHWYLPAIRELVALKDFRADPFWMAGKLGITPVEARDGFATLLRIGLVAFDGQAYKRSVPSVQPRGKLSKVRMDEFNRQCSERALSAIPLAKDQRYFNALTVAISDAAFKKIPEILSRLIAEIDMLAEADPQRDDVAIVNVQFFSATANQSARGEISLPTASQSLTGE